MTHQLRIVVLIWGMMCCGMAEDSPGSLIGKIAPDFTLKTVDNRSQHSLKDFRGQVVLLDFWASWCPPCKKSLPELARLQAQYKGMKVLTINIDDKSENAADFIARFNLKLITLYDREKTVVENYNIAGMPAALLIDQKGVVRHIFSGYTEKNMEEIREAVEDLL